MRCNHSNVNVKTEKKYSKQNDIIEFNTFKKYTTLYHTIYFIVNDTFRSQVFIAICGRLKGRARGSLRM